MKSDREFSGILLGFDDFVSECLEFRSQHRLMPVSDMVLEDVTE